jgi:hypothetical protein
MQDAVVEHTYIYALHDPRDWSIRYVGKSNDPHARLKMHMRRPIRLGLSRLVRELKLLGLKLQISILQQCSSTEWPVWEKFWIATARNSGENLLNIFDGGNGAPIFYTSEHRMRISAGLKGKPKSLEHRENLSKANIGKRHTPEEIAKQAAAQRGKKKPPCSPERKARISAANKGKTLGRPQSAEHKAKRLRRWEELRAYRNSIQPKLL